MTFASTEPLAFRQARPCADRPAYDNFLSDPTGSWPKRRPPHRGESGAIGERRIQQAGGPSEDHHIAGHGHGAIVESLWREGKSRIANRQYHDVLDEVLAFVHILSHLSECQALTIAGVLPPSFWLRHVRSKFLGNRHDG